MSVEWSAPGIVLAARPYGEGDALAVVFTKEHGVYRGLARGGLSRARASTWQAGNLVEARWMARLTDQLGSFAAELVHGTAALAMADALDLAVLSSACAVAEGALPERQAQPRTFQGLLHLLAHLGSAGLGSLADLSRWERDLLAELGYGLDLSACALTGATAGLAFVSPRTGRAVSAEAATPWAGRLLVLPAFLCEGETGEPDVSSCQDALTLTGHFLAQETFGAQHKPLPLARTMLAERVRALSAV